MCMCEGKMGEWKVNGRESGGGGEEGEREHGWIKQGKWQKGGRDLGGK